MCRKVRSPVRLVRLTFERPGAVKDDQSPQPSLFSVALVFIGIKSLYAVTKVISMCLQRYCACFGLLAGFEQNCQSDLKAAV